MKNVIFLLLFSLTLIVAQQTYSQQSVKDSIQLTQTETPARVVPTTVKTELNADQILTAPPVEKVGFFKKLIDGIKGSGLTILISIICGILSKNGITKIIKSIAGKTAIATEVGVNVLESVHNLADLVDKSIKDDNTVDQNTLQEAITAGKAVVTTFKDAIVTIKPKPTATIPVT